MMETVELLSPAGDFETALAAFDAGADAVYCGLGDFSARAFAVNFSAEDLRNLVRVAHARGRRVYVTFNTLVDEADLEKAVGRLADLADIGPDALIVQDLGVARLVRRHFPELALHASTQLVAHNLEGVLQLRELGFTRVVLARELSLGEIASIAKRCGGLELEAFIHGALCYSVSGLCLFSAMEKGRSGNRGKCAYCCRLGYGAAAEDGASEDAAGRRVYGDGRTFPFSMKDLRLGEDVRKLVQAGVVSLKIEGRMKSALYVASVTKYYRQILDAGSGEGAHAVTVADLETVFSRRTTELYLNGSNLQSNNSPSSPIDPTSLGHLGTPIGTVKRVTRDREGRAWVRFHTSRALERHDGLQFVPPAGARISEKCAHGEGVKPFGFGISEMRTALSRSTVFEVAAGTDVEVLLPEEEGRTFEKVGRESRSTAVGRSFEKVGRDSRSTAARRVDGGVAGVDSIRPGTIVYCSMSNAVKRMFPSPSFRPSDYPGEKALDVAVSLEKTRISVCATFDRVKARSNQDEDAGAGAGGGSVLAAGGGSGSGSVLAAGGGAGLVSVTVESSGEFAPAKDPSRTFAAVEKAFAKLGGTDYRLGKLTLNDPDRLFAPASMLNDLRRDLVERIETARARARRERIEKALADDASPSVCGRISPKCAGEEKLSSSTVHFREMHPRLDGSPLPQRTIRLRAGQAVPAGEWDEVVVLISPNQTISNLKSQNPESGTPANQTISNLKSQNPESGTPANQSISSNQTISNLKSQNPESVTPPDLRLALPVYTKEPEFNALRTTVKRFLRAGFAKWEASDLATLRMLRQLGVTDITADWTLYAFNSQALAALAELGVTRFVASPENDGANLAFLAESGYSVACLVQQSTPLFISLTEPAVSDGRTAGDLRIFRQGDLWITTKCRPRTFDCPSAAPSRVDLSWDPPIEETTA